MMNRKSACLVALLLHASLLFKARHDGELGAVLERLQAADMTSAQRQDFDALRTGYEARQRQVRSTSAGEAADRGPVLTAGTVYRHRSGGIGRPGCRSDRWSCLGRFP